MRQGLRVISKNLSEHRYQDCLRRRIVFLFYVPMLRYLLFTRPAYSDEGGFDSIAAELDLDDASIAMGRVQQPPAMIT